MIDIMKKNKRKVRPRQSVSIKKGMEEKMKPKPVYENLIQGKLLMNKVALVTGGDSGIGRAVCIAFAQEGATLVIAYDKDDRDAKITAEEIKKAGGECILIRGDIAIKKHCINVISRTARTFGKVDIIVNNAAVQFPQKKLQRISEKQLKRTFAVNIFSQFYIVQAAERFLKKGASIINTTSVTAYRGSDHLLDYSATKGAILSFTRSLSAYFAQKGIRVNAVAPGPVWTPLIPSTFTPKEVATFGSDTPMGRAGQPAELAPAYVFLASDHASYITGQVIHVNGGEIVNG
jgi:NAD(P)-dependent dehydrogenase (short-subunit alcohol dehydrogenase family)